MIASRAGLYVLAAIALALAVFVVIDSGRRGIVDRRIAPGLDADAVTEIDIAGAWQGKLVRGEHGWTRDRAPITRDAPDAILAAVRGGHWHRRADRATGGSARATITLVAGPQKLELAVGQPLAGSEQTWLLRAHDAVLVDDWIAHALAPDELALADRKPLATLAGAPRIRLGDGFELAGDHMERPLPLAISPKLVETLGAAASRLELVAAAPHVVVRDASAPKLAWADSWADDAGPCDPAGTRIVVVTSRGQGCADAAQWNAVLAAIAAFHRPPAELVDRRPLAAAPRRRVLGDGTILDRTKRPQVAGKDADLDRIAELLAALVAPAEVAQVPTAPPTATLTADAVTLDLYEHDKVLARHGEPFALRPTKDAWEMITRPGSAYADATRWLEDPTTISTITIDGKPHQRGGALGEWTNTKKPKIFETLADAVATLRAPAGPAPKTLRHHLTLEITAPTGTSSHKLDLGDRCAALADQAPVLLPPALCTAITAAL